MSEGIEFRKNARDEEVFASRILKNNFFRGRKLIVGDLFENKEPDIFTEDHKYGIDIVRSEALGHFVFEKFKSDCANLGYDHKLCQTLANEHYSSWNFNVVKDERNGRIKAFESNLKNVTKTEYYEVIESNLRRKLDKLNCGNYSSCERIGICLISNLSPKNGTNLRNILRIYNNVKKDFNKTFDDVFIMFKKSFYHITKSNKVSYFELDNKEHKRSL
ncbi:MAG: hypothetical protein RR400_02685 [Clostridia bacterium]